MAPLTRKMKQSTKRMKDASSLQDKSTADDSSMHEPSERLTRSKSLTEPIRYMANQRSKDFILSGWQKLSGQSA